MAWGGEDRPTDIGKRFAGYQVHDRHYGRVGKVDDLFVDENDRPEYIGVKTGLFGHSTLIPMTIVRVNDKRRLVEVNADLDTIKAAPTFSGDDEITPEFEGRIHSHYRLEGDDRYRASEPARSHGSPTGEGTSREHAGARHDVFEDRDHRGGEVGPGMRMGDTESGEFRGHDSEREGPRQPGSDLEDRDELRVQRSEEELRVGTREREAGSVNVRKRVRTERERLHVPTRREEVTVERVPVEAHEAPEAEIGGGEVHMPVVEEEVVVEKRAVVKEELRIRKDVVQEEEVIEADVRKEEVDVYDETTGRHGGAGPRGR